MLLCLATIGFACAVQTCRRCWSSQSVTLQGDHRPEVRYCIPNKNRRGATQQSRGRGVRRSANKNMITSGQTEIATSGYEEMNANSNGGLSHLRASSSFPFDSANRPAQSRHTPLHQKRSRSPGLSKFGGVRSTPVDMGSGNVTPKHPNLGNMYPSHLDDRQDWEYVDVADPSVAFRQGQWQVGQGRRPDRETRVSTPASEQEEVQRRTGASSAASSRCATRMESVHPSSLQAWYNRTKAMGSTEMLAASSSPVRV